VQWPALVGGGAVRRGHLANLHICDNEKLDKSDNMAKIRPFFAMMNEKCLQYFLNQEELSTDESMLLYYGRHSGTQRIIGKPIRMGYAIFFIYFYYSLLFCMF